MFTPTKNVKRRFQFILSMVIGLVFGAFMVLFLLHFEHFKITHIAMSHDIAISPLLPKQAHAKLQTLPSKPVKNLIMFLGDGMGINQIDLARIEYYGASGRLHMERMPFTALLRTHSANHLITDSAAAATAYAIGVKTANKMIAMTPDLLARRTIMEAARDRGMATGLITTTRLSDATPAAFAAHVAHRSEQSEIALQMAASRINVLVGDLAYFFPQSDPRSLRQDDIDVIDIARRNGYVFVETEAEWSKATASHVLANFSNNPLDGEHGEPQVDTLSLAQLTRKAIELLEQDNDGFFLLVEEEGIDTGGHRNEYRYMLEHLKNLDDAVGVGLQYALRKSNTLVLVLSDHETGGLTFSKEKRVDNDYVAEWSTAGHTGQSVPLFAFGPHSERFSGAMDNTDVPLMLAHLLHLTGVAAPLNAKTTSQGSR